MNPVPQPAVDRMVDFRGHPIVVGVVPGQPELVALTAQSLGRAIGAPALHFAYVDTSRYVVEEHEGGDVTHAPLDPDTADDTWQLTHDELEQHIGRTLGATSLPWRLRYLAGRPDRALTHLSRAVDAAAIVVGTRSPGPAARLRTLLDGSVAVHLSHHQHRPVLTVPLSVVDWREISAPWEH